MHYYQFNIGDYSSHTSRLSLLEDLAYRRLLDLYYLTERPFNGCSTAAAREIGMSEHLDDVEFVLNKYFELADGGWVNSRVEKEVASYKNKKAASIRAGKASGKARRSKAKERPLNDRSTTVEPNINQEPITNNQKKEKAAPSKAWETPKGVNLIAWSEFEDHRKQIKKPLSDIARTKAANLLVNLTESDQQLCVDYSITGRYTGLFPDRFNKANAAKPKRAYGAGALN